MEQRTQAAPQAEASGAPARRDLDRTMRRIAARLKRDFAAEIARDAAGFKKRAVHRLKVYLPPGPGRPCLEFITRAAEMRAQDKLWKDIYPACIPDYATLDPPPARWRSGT